MTLLQRTRRTRRPALASLSMLVYLIAVAVVPPGYMAAPLASGTPFHLCPGDIRSALLIDALRATSSGSVEHGHHHSSDGGTDDAHASTTVAEPDCRFAGVTAMYSGIAFAATDMPAPVQMVQTVFRGPANLSPAWLRPPARSPPA